LHKKTISDRQIKCAQGADARHRSIWEYLGRLSFPDFRSLTPGPPPFPRADSKADLARLRSRQKDWVRLATNGASSHRFGFVRFRRRTLGPLPFSLMNSTPADCSTIFVLNSNAGTLRRWLRLLRFAVLQSDSASSAQAVPRLFNAPEETWIMFETVVEPVFF
jgi:hypothetical protein